MLLYPWNISVILLQAVCSLDEPPEFFSGLSIELFRNIAQDIGWQEGVDFRFECLMTSTDEVMLELANGVGVCDAAIASITISTERKQSGVLFSYPYLKGAVGIMVLRDEGHASGWNWVRPFSTDLWIAIIVTMFIL